LNKATSCTTDKERKKKNYFATIHRDPEATRLRVALPKYRGSIPAGGGGVNWQECEADRYIHLLPRLEIREVILLLRHIPSENGKVKILYRRTR